MSKSFVAILCPSSIISIIESSRSHLKHDDVLFHLFAFALPLVLNYLVCHQNIPTATDLHTSFSFYETCKLGVKRFKLQLVQFVSQF